MRLFKALGAARTRLTHIGKNEPLNFLSIVIILALDLFVLWNIFQGLGFQRDQLTTAREAVPYNCQQLFEKRVGNQNYDWDLIRDGISVGSESQVRRTYKTASSTEYINNARDNQVIPECRELLVGASNLAEANQVIEKKEQIDRSNSEIYNLQQNTRDLKSDYDTTLLESIAGQDENLSITEGSAQSIKRLITANDSQIQKLQGDITKSKTEILALPASQKFINLVNTNKASIKAQYAKLKFWHPIKELSYQLLFLLPLLVIFFSIYRYSAKREKTLLTLIFSHLLVVVSIPIVIEVFRLLLHILPFHLFSDFIALLDAMGLVAIWNYLLILFGIGASLGLIYLVQKKLFSRERQSSKRIAKGQCCHCGVKIGDETAFCFSCGEAHTKACSHCGKQTFIEGRHCRHCGESNR